MRRTCPLLLAVLMTVALTLTASAQQGYWSVRGGTSGIVPDKAVARLAYPKEFKLFDLNLPLIRQELFAITDKPGASTVIALPNADGGIEQYEVFEASNFEPELQAAYPQIRAFSGKGITDKYATLKLSIAPDAIQTMVFRVDKEDEFIEPYSEDHTVYSVFRSHREKGGLPWVCTTVDEKPAIDLNKEIYERHDPLSSAGQIKTMRLAQSCNGEYANYFGATAVGQYYKVLAAFNATLTRCNGCYEKDLALHLLLIANDSLVVYYNPSTDPYTTLSNWNSQLQATLTANIGEANYDIGHMFGSTGGGGNAGCIGCVCVDGQKGSGITSPADGIPQGDNFDIDYVVHEVGHQLGANHTFSYSNEGYGVNKEVGAGITIMGYAGITSYDPAPHSIDIYHEASIQQIQTNLATKTCPVTTTMTANHPPVVATVSNYTIPISTPFALTGSATDPENDALTYCWEQNDAGGSQTGSSSVASPTKTTGPNWLSFSPTASPTRLFPKLSTIQSGLLVTPPITGGDASVNIEALSSVSRTLNYRLTVRDNRPYVPGSTIGQTQYTDMAVTVTNTSGPFQVTSPNTAVSWTGGTTNTITWNVASTTASPVSCANVKISLSTDAGSTWGYVLSASTPNDGSEALVIPNIATTTARVKVEGVGNIFFDISNANFTIVLGGPTMTVTAPNGGESWPIGTSQTITWTSSGVTGNVNIDLSTDGGVTFPTSIAANTANDGTEPWTVSGPVSSLARVRVLSVSAPSVRDSSNANFSMVQPTITVTAPNGGENWPVGSAQTLTWTSFGVTGTVNIDLSTDGGATFPTAIATNTANDGTEAWTVSGPVSALARVRVSSVTAPSVRDSSNANFTMAQPTITVSAPNGGEMWPIGSSQTITWTSFGVTGNVSITLSTDGGATFPTTIAASTANDGTEAWTVTGPASAQARVRVTSVSAPSVRDSSNANFSIVQPTITVTVPNGGESWVLGTAQTITWTSAYMTGNVKIDESTDGGATFPVTIAASTANDGTEAWTVAGSATSSARIRITSLTYPTVLDASDANFAVVPPVITVVSPNGGESWTGGSSQTIQWSSVSLTGNVRIDLSTDGGTTFPTVIIANTANDGSEPWTVPTTGTSAARIRVASLAVPSVADTSNANFTILQPAIAVTSPNGGESWGIGSVQTIQWSSVAISGSVNVELSRDGGTTYETLFAGTTNDGTESWTVTAPVTTNARIRVTSVSAPTVSDVSNAPFEITVSFTVLQKLYIHDAWGETDSLDFGTGPGATDGMDVSFGEYELPPLPPTGVLDVRWKSTGLQGLDRDIRDTLGGTRQSITYVGQMQPGAGDYPMVLRWNRAGLPAGSFIVRDNPSGANFTVDMKSQDSVVVSNADVTAFQVIYSLGTTVNSSVASGWSLLSVPVSVSDLRRTALFPASVGTAYMYSPTGYVGRDTLGYRLGYWLKFTSAQSLTLTGGQRVVDTVSVSAGWNMIGSISNAVTVAGIVQVPDSIVTSQYFGYSPTGYAATTTIDPMHGYWVKTRQAGILILHAGAKK
jgi:hypothetical protein